MDTLTKKQKREIKRLEKLASRESAAKKKHIKKYSIWTGVFVLFAVSIFGLVKLAPNMNNDNGQSAALALAITEEDHFKGGKSAQVELVEYSDFQCPACASYAPLVRSIAEEFGDNLKIVYRHFPLNQIHENADLAARVSEAAGMQNKFWEMHDLIFANQDKWSVMKEKEAEDFFEGLAVSLALDIEKFQADINSDKVKEKVARDLASGYSSGVMGTPTFFLNGEKIQNPRSAADFKGAINDKTSSEL